MLEEGVQKRGLRIVSEGWEGAVVEDRVEIEVRGGEEGDGCQEEEGVAEKCKEEHVERCIGEYEVMVSSLLTAATTFLAMRWRRDPG